MYQIVNVEQGSQEWLDLRRNKITATDSCVIMGVSPWRTPLQLWQDKIQGTQQEQTEAMKRGSRLEPGTLERFNKMSESDFKPVVIISDKYPWMMASLDGLDDVVCVEIKHPNIDDHNEAKKGRVPKKYYPQCQHQLTVLGHTHMIYLSSHLGDDEIVIVERDDDYIAEMIIKEKEFFDRLQNFDAPPETERDIITIDDVHFEKLSFLYRNIKEQLERLKIVEQQLRDELIEIAADRTVQGGGIRIRKVISAGRIEYDKIEQLKGLDLNRYRKESSVSWRITTIE